MPLIKCPECKKKVSDQCGNCPRCGYPIEKVAANIEPKPEKTLKEENIEPAKKKEKEREKKPINKKLLIRIISISVVLLLVCCVLGYNALLPRINATSAFNSAVESVEQKNVELQAAITKSEQLIAKNLPLLDETHITKLENAISDTKAAKVTDFEKPSKVEDIVSRTAELNAVDYTNVLANLSDKHNALEINAKRYQLVNVPTEAYVIQRLKTISDITGISAVTEDHDPNGNLNKLGGYTSTVYFSHKNLKLDKSIYGKTLIDQGTDAGGAIEVYTCVEDAIKRRDYLARFDGTITASGTHTVIGTVLVRTSDKLTASQQKAFEAKLIAALTYIEEVDGKKETPKTTPTSSKTSSTVSVSKKATQQNTTSKTVMTSNQNPNREQTGSKPSTTPANNRDAEAIETARWLAYYDYEATPADIQQRLVNEEGFSIADAKYCVSKVDNAALEGSRYNWIERVKYYVTYEMQDYYIEYTWCNNCGEVYGVYQMDEKCPICGRYILCSPQSAFGYTKAEVISQLKAEGFSTSDIQRGLEKIPSDKFYDESKYKKP